MLRTVSILALAAALLSCQALPQTAGNAENGKRLFVRNGCYQCHGYDGHGGTGPKLAPKPLPAAVLIAYLRHPAPGGMPVYSAKVMSDAEVTDVWAYLKSMPEAPAVKDIPLLTDK
jgi:ubiquinol-cytochrome c reductase cytochrome c subunit